MLLCHPNADTLNTLSEKNLNHYVIIKLNKPDLYLRYIGIHQFGISQGRKFQYKEVIAREISDP